MEIYYGICAGIFTSAVVVAVVYLVGTLEQIRKTAEQAQKTAASIDQLARHIDESAEAVGNVSQNIAAFSENLKSGWVRAAQLAVGFLAGLRQNASASAGDEERAKPPAHEAAEER